MLVLLAAWVGLSLSERRLKVPITASDLNDLVFYSLLGYLLGGRLFDALENLPQVQLAPLSLFSLQGMFSPWGAWLSAILVAGIYLSRRRLPLWETLDSLVPFFATLLVGLSLANLASGDGFGRETSVPWAWELWGARRHPSQLYELIAATLTLGIVLRLNNAAPGALFWRFLALTSGWVLFLQAFRGDSHFLPGGLRMEQVLAWGVLALSLWRIGKEESHGCSA
uniref:Beta-galactosamide-alpha-2,3-sialyltransferase n=1 Tax=uncultured Chloroflexota bacterium TaxID=166587 RepID=H5S996_9CHLR|nr:beta-galactosamide-alpha-2,3-sialyltransferase [uncultured Chloroflexota bacterium]